jgi:uncharacterized protein (TIGR03083 family)
VQDSITKAELIEKVRAARAEWEALLAQIDPEHMGEPGVTSDWSVKDIVAHIGFWERSVLDGLRTGERGLQGEVDEINERVFRTNRDRPLDQVLAEAREIYRDLLAAIEALPEDAPTAPYRFTWTGGRPVWVVIAGNTYWHYPEHGESIRAWLAGK